jgi:hypothetical protein
MPRTSEAAVKKILLIDYDSDAATDLSPFIDTASAVVDRVEACAIAKGKALSATELELIERWLSAHFYGQSDQPYTSRSTAGASGQFQGRTDMGFDSTKYGQSAIRIDYSGCLLNIDKRQRARVIWLGKNPSSQIDYEDRR